MKQVLLLGVVGHDDSNGQLELPDVARLDDNRAVEGGSGSTGRRPASHACSTTPIAVPAS